MIYKFKELKNEAQLKKEQLDKEEQAREKIKTILTSQMFNTLKENKWFGTMKSRDFRDEEEEEDFGNQEDFELIKLKDKSVFQVDRELEEYKIETTFWNPDKIEIIK